MSIHHFSPFRTILQLLLPSLLPAIISTNNQSPLDLPKIRLRVAVYVEWRDVHSCLFVSKDWYHSFKPFLLKRIVLKYNRSEKHHSPDFIKSYCDYVDSLHLENVPPADYAISYPNLQSLYYLWDNTAGRWTDSCNPAPFFKLNPTLVDLELTLYGASASVTFACWKALSGLTHLRKLSLRYSFIPESSAVDFRKVCGRLNTLHLSGVTIPASAFLADTKFPQMRDIYLIDSVISHGVTLGDLNMTWRCPGLESLNCNILSYYVCSRTCPNLRKLTLRGTTSDSRLASILREMRQATSLDFKGIYFGSATVQELERHFHTLTDLNLKNCKAVTSNTVRAIICSCSQLQNLHADCIMATDAVSGEPWVCLSIRELDVLFEFTESEQNLQLLGESWVCPSIRETDVFFEFTESEQNLQLLIFERLSALVQLRNLSVGLTRFQSGKESTHGLDIRLSRGLQSLESLKQLESLNVSGTVQSIGEEDVNWMVTNWRSLRKFLGTKNTVDETTNKMVGEILKQHGVKIESSKRNQCDM